MNIREWLDKRNCRPSLDEKVCRYNAFTAGEISREGYEEGLRKTGWKTGQRKINDYERWLVEIGWRSGSEKRLVEYIKKLAEEQEVNLTQNPVTDSFFVDAKWRSGERDDCDAYIIEYIKKMASQPAIEENPQIEPSKLIWTTSESDRKVA